MKKRIWLCIQENSTPENGALNRHYWFAMHLKKRGYEPVVFVGSKARNSDKQMISSNDPFLIDESHGFPYVYLRVNNYGDSMVKRLIAIVEFHFRLLKYSQTFSQMYGKPDIILGSSNYPITPTLAIMLARRYKANSICEVRDLWPLSLEEYAVIPRGGFIAKLMYLLEKHNYSMADAIVFTMEGGKQYILDKKLDSAHGGPVDLNKIWHINNGVDLDTYDSDKVNFIYDNAEYVRSQKFRAVYTGSIRRANNIGFLLDVANCLKNDQIELFIFGDGGEVGSLRQQAASRNLDNIHFMGHVDKPFIPSVLAQADLLLMYSRFQRGISQYGMSQNKLFDYLASGHPIISNLPANRYSVINANDCGVEKALESPEQYADALRAALENTEKISVWEENARKAAESYSFEALTDMLIRLIESL